MSYYVASARLGGPSGAASSAGGGYGVAAAAAAAGGGGGDRPPNNNNNNYVYNHDFVSGRTQQRIVWTRSQEAEVARRYNAGQSIPEIRNNTRPGEATQCVHEKIRGLLKRNPNIPGVICITQKRQDLAESAHAYVQGRPRNGSISGRKRGRRVEDGCEKDDQSSNLNYPAFGPRDNRGSLCGGHMPTRPSSSSSSSASASASSSSSSSSSSSYNNTHDESLG